MNDKPSRVPSAPATTYLPLGAAAAPILAAVAALLSLTGPATATAQDFGCTASARLLRYACAADLRDDFFTATAQCLDTASPDEECTADAETDFDDGREECGEVFAARLELCEAVEDATHEPAFGMPFADNFVDPTQIGSSVAPNPYFPLVAGNRWVYESEDETITVEVLEETKLIDGVTCVTVNDVVSEDEVVVEDTDDWYAQDLDGNVWYCGEIAQNFEVFDGDEPELPELIDIEGSWKHARDGAEAGLLIPIEPEPGDVIRQEVKYTDAEDAIEILSVTASETAPGGACADSCLHTRDFSPLEPDVEEEKFYAPGIGLIVELDPETGERVELIEFMGVGL